MAVLSWLISGNDERSIIEALREKFPDADPRSVLAAVTRVLESEGTPNVDALRGWALLSLRDLYRRMVDIGDFAGALKAVKQIVDLAK